MNSNVLIIQSKEIFAEALTLALQLDNHNVLPPVFDIKEAYDVMMNHEVDIVVLDAHLGDPEQIERLSDTLSLLEIPHIVNFGEALHLQKRLPLRPGYFQPKLSVAEACPAPVINSITHLVWEMHVNHTVRDSAIILQFEKAIA